MTLPGAAAAFVDAYLTALRALEPREVTFSPCLGYGRGGVAYTLLKAGVLRGDRGLVRAATRWAAAGVRAAHRYRLRGWPKASFSRGLTGLHAIQALAHHAGGDDAGRRRALGRFVAAARSARGSIELFQGMGGRLAGAAIVMRRIPDVAVRALGDDLAFRTVGALEAGVRFAPVGVAHGRPGVVLAALAWQAVARSLPEDALGRAVLAEHPYDVSGLGGHVAGDWAHGHAGMAHLFARAYLQLGDRRFLVWARAAAKRAMAVPSSGLTLVAGAPGIVYSLLAVAEADPEGPWRDRAVALAAQALSIVDVPDFAPFGVWSGLGGLACLALDLIHGTSAGFPGVEA